MPGTVGSLGCWLGFSASSKHSWLLCLWNDQSFRVDSRARGRGYILLKGEWILENQKVTIVNVYSPCDSVNKRELWKTLRPNKEEEVDASSGSGSDWMGGDPNVFKEKQWRPLTRKLSISAAILSPYRYETLFL